MIDRDELSRHRPATAGPSQGTTERATRAFREFLNRQAQTAIPIPAGPRRALSRTRSFAMAGIAALLLAAGGVAYAAFGAGDGVFYTGPATEIAETGGLSFIPADSNIGPCLEVRSDQGMAGGCGGDFDELLTISVGSIGKAAFATGYGPPGTARIEMTFPNGEVVAVTSFATLEEYDVMFFMTTLPPTSDNEPLLPVQTVALDPEGNTLATVSRVVGPDTP